MGLKGLGGKGRVLGMVGQGQGIDERDPAYAGQRGLERDEVPMAGRGVEGGAAAEERILEGL